MDRRKDFTDNMNKLVERHGWCDKCQTIKPFCVCDWVCATCKEHPNDCKCTVVDDTM